MVEKKNAQIGEIRIPEQKYLSMFVHGFDSFTVTAYFNLLFIALENGFSTFYKHVCPSKKDTGSILNIYDDILKELKLTRYFELMEILRHIRIAVMHQNGIYDSGNKKLEWNKKTITFTKGKRVDYGGEVWEVLPSLSQGVVDMLKQVVNSNQIIQVPKIIDPSYADL